jgi:hypothetical protein
MKKIWMLLPFVVTLILHVIIFGYAAREQVDTDGLVGLSLLFTGLFVIVLGIFRDQIKTPKPLMNLGVIFIGSLLTILAAVQLAYISDLFEKWVSYVLMVAVFAMALIYALLLAQKKTYDEIEDEDI